MKITKLKHRGGKTTVIGETVNGNHVATEALRACPDPPLESFKEALATVTSDVLKAVGIPGKGFADAFSVTGVNVDTETSGRRGFSFRTTMVTPMGPQHAGLPRMTERTGDEAGPRVLSDVAVKHVEALLKEAEAYFNGSRVQEQVDAFESAGGE